MPAYGIICENDANDEQIQQIWGDENGKKFLSYEEAKDYAIANEIKYVKIIDGVEKNAMLQKMIPSLHEN